MELTEGEEGMVTDLDSDLSTGPPMFEYDLDEQGKRLKLGEGSFGVVYSARDTNTHVCNNYYYYFNELQTNYSSGESCCQGDS